MILVNLHILGYTAIKMEKLLNYQLDNQRILEFLFDVNPLLSNVLIQIYTSSVIYKIFKNFTKQ